MIMVIDTRHGIIMARSWHGHHEIKHDHAMAVMENRMIMYG